MIKISGVYKITNIITGDFYIGSSNNIKKRWTSHRSHAIWKQCPNSKLYKDMQKYGRDNFLIEVLEETDALKEREQYYIDQLKPMYNNFNAKDRNIDKSNAASRRYHKKHDNKLCSYNGTILTLCALSQRFKRANITHYCIEAKKYLIRQEKINNV